MDRLKRKTCLGPLLLQTCLVVIFEFKVGMDLLTRTIDRFAVGLGLVPFYQGQVW